MKRILVVAAATLLMMVVTAVAADDEVIRVHLVGYQETPLTINTAATGEFKIKIHSDGSAIDYEETYRDLSSSVLQSHIHFGRPALTGGVVLFLCTNLTPPVGVPTPQPCPTTNPATITGTLTAADVIASSGANAGQAIDPGAAGFAEMIKAIREGAAYVNVHTTNHPSGEIRSRLGPLDLDHRRDHDRSHDH
ncbi:MAG: CHRD domain-containing protein [Terriglobales bacterium]